ncbi:MAG: FIG00927682: hypothetical protein, partial [uncultured Phycisphaerae bacterium]
EPPQADQPPRLPQDRIGRDVGDAGLLGPAPLGGRPTRAAAGAVVGESGPHCGHRHRPMDGRGDGAHGHVRPEAVHPLHARRRVQGGAQHVPGDRHGCRSHQAVERPGADRVRDGPGDADPLVRRGRPRVHPALAAPVPLAHRLRAAADGPRAAHGRVHRPHLGPARPGGAGVHQHRPAVRRRRGRGAQGVHDGRLPRQRVRAVQHPLPPGRDQRRPPAGRHDAGAVRGPQSVLQEAPGGQPGRAGGQRVPEGVVHPLDGQRPPPAQLPRRPGVRPVAGAEGERRALPPGRRGPEQPHRRRPPNLPLRARLPAGPAADGGRGAVHRGDDRVRAVPRLGHARERPHAARRHEADDRLAGRAARDRPGFSRPAGAHTDRAGERVQPGHDDRGGRRQPPGGQEQPGAAGPDPEPGVLRHAPPLHAGRQRADVRRRHEARPRPRRHRRRAAVQDDQGPGGDRGPPRQHLPR